MVSNLKLDQWEQLKKERERERERYYNNYLDYIGQLLTVKFQEYTEDGVPRFPVAKGFREEADISHPKKE